jgi:Ca2+-binding EF-hand superfamily protein
MEVHQGSWLSAVLYSNAVHLTLNNKTQDWQGVFLHFDRDRSGTIESNELQAALAQFGYRLSPQLLGLLQRKYGTICSFQC